ncbi:translocation protein TolB [Mariprofundus micogutta]|uniref:Translocation protein TolB n=1 Tax=Mariprofundus micogutta TaxID=1921010 RepID=A0A1L8CJR4_9PROT|nr:PD40 domain-containing protein [Mariprofundus micogutta]GAV19130.1 translocation protein TolB [Mariprofundus micogutta]
MKVRHLVLVSAALLVSIQNVSAKKISAPEEALFPVSPLVTVKGVESFYPSVAGDFMVYAQRKGHHYSVLRTSTNSPSSGAYELKPLTLIDEMRYGVAVNDGSIGYVSNRMGPISSWMWQGQGDGHVSIGNMATYRGGLAPFHLNASSDGNVWCFDSTFQKMRYNQLLSEFSKPMDWELVGQQWRMYDSDNFRPKTGYLATKEGKKNKFETPVLFTFVRSSSQLVMIPNAFNGAISPDGKRVAFVRQTNGNYDIWMQNIDGGGLTQLTSSPYGDFEPAWSPDGKRLLFVSNRDSKGDVHNTSIYMLNIKSIQVQRLTNARRAVDGGPAWLDNKSIVFHSNRNIQSPQSSTGRNWNIWKLKLN